jgi:hypothetical protein
VPYATAKEWRNAWTGEAGRWRDKKATRAALHAFDQINASELDRVRTLKRIADACIDAQHYQPDADPGVKYRRAMSEQRAKVAKLAAAAHTLAKACERADRAMFWSLDGGSNALQVRLARPHDGQLVDVMKMGAAWFNELEQGLKKKMPELHGGPFFDRFTIGNLHFDAAIEAGRKPKVSTMLAFELVFYLRMFTAGRAADSWQVGQDMPKDGEPHHQLAAMFCNATLGSQLDDEQVRDRLRKLPPGIGLKPWPKNAE